MEDEKLLKTIHFPARGEQYKELYQIVMEVTAIFDKHNADGSTVCSVISLLIDVMQKDMLEEKMSLEELLASIHENIMLSRRVNRHQY